MGLQLLKSLWLLWMLKEMLYFEPLTMQYSSKLAKEPNAQGDVAMEATAQRGRFVSALMDSMDRIVKKLCASPDV